MSERPEYVISVIHRRVLQLVIDGCNEYENRYRSQGKRDGQLEAPRIWLVAKDECDHDRDHTVGYAKEYHTPKGEDFCNREAVRKASFHNDRFAESVTCS